MGNLRFIILLFMLVIFSCKQDEEKTKLVQVHDKILYIEDLYDIIPDDASNEDSIIIVNNKIDLWVRKQTILYRAELNLSDQQKDIESVVEDYRASLLIEKYKQEYIKQELDTIISDKEIEDYYNSYPESFNLNEEIVKVLYYKVPNNYNKLNDFRNSFYSNNEENKENLFEFVKEGIVKYNDFKSYWIEISSISNLLPKSINNAEVLLQQNDKIQMRDEEFHYFVHFEDYKLKGDLMPLDLAKGRIKIILLNKRKTNIVNDLESKIYQNAIKNGNIQIFVD